MPYSTVDDLPPAVQELSEEHRRQWMAVFNEVFAETGSEAMAFAAAWGAVNKGKSCTALKTAPDGTPIMVRAGQTFTVSDDEAERLIARWGDLVEPVRTIRLPARPALRPADVEEDEGGEVSPDDAA
jgi:cation transport regulator ChaB